MRVSQETFKRQTLKSIVGIAILVPVVLLHFVTGRAYRGPYPEFVNGYLLDILLPFAVYLLMCPYDVFASFLRPWPVKASPVFAVAFSAEIAQYHGVRVFGSTYDPLDFAMYGVGILSAAFVDTRVFPRIFRFWAPQEEGAV